MERKSPLSRVLVVEDEESFSDALSYMLRKEGFEVSVAATGTDALTEFDRTGADIVLLDLMLPEMSGTEVCRQLRQRSAVPIIMVTARDSEIDKVVGLEIGADDYVTKPYSPRELVARIRAVLRRQSPEVAEAGAPTLAAGPVRMDIERHVVTVDGGAVQLPLKEFELLELLLRNAGRVLTRGQLIDRVWGPTTSVTPRRWTCTSSACAPRSSRSRPRRASSSPCGVWATSSSRDRRTRRACARRGPLQAFRTVAGVVFFSACRAAPVVGRRKRVALVRAGDARRPGPTGVPAPSWSAAPFPGQLYREMGWSVGRQRTNQCLGDTARVRSGAVQNNLCKAAAMSATSVSRLSVTLMTRSYAMSWSTSSS